MAELVEPRQCQFAGILGQLRLVGAGLDHLGQPQAGRAAEHDQIDQAVGAEAVGAMDRNAGRLADREQAGDDAVRDCRPSG